MSAFAERSARFLRDFAARFAYRRDNAPIGTVDDLQHFVTSRSAFVAQHKLYGYLKARMGTRYPPMFEDDIFIQSVNVAKMHVFAACLSDLTVHAVARSTAGSELDHAERGRFAEALYDGGIAEFATDAAVEGDRTNWRTEFGKRLDKVNWENLAAGGDAFTESPAALVRWAPIADELKKYDVEIVRNSVRYAWNEVIRSLRRRLDAVAIQAELRR